MVCTLTVLHQGALQWIALPEVMLSHTVPATFGGTHSKDV